jgi:hypothetical protein
MLSDEKSRAKYDASRRSSPSWDPFSWESERKSAQKSQHEEFYGFGNLLSEFELGVNHLYETGLFDR